MRSVSVNTLWIQSSTTDSLCIFPTILRRNQPTSGWTVTLLERFAFQPLGSRLGDLSSFQKCSDTMRRLRFLIRNPEELTLDFLSQKIALTKPPSTRGAALLAAEESSVAKVGHHLPDRPSLCLKARPQGESKLHFRRRKPYADPESSYGPPFGAQLPYAWAAHWRQVRQSRFQPGIGLLRES